MVSALCLPPKYSANCLFLRPLSLEKNGHSVYYLDMYFPRPRVPSLVYSSLNTKYNWELLKMEKKKLKGDSSEKKGKEWALKCDEFSVLKICKWPWMIFIIYFVVETSTEDS